jgi:hypothetical protein
MAYITFTDSVGAAQLDNGLRLVAGGVGSRFANWVPRVTPIGSAETLLATGALHMFRFRTDNTASFTIEHIPVASLDIAVRLIAHLLQGGTCAVYTEDSASRSYLTCGLAPGSEPQLSMEDRADLWYRLDLTLLNLASPSAIMLCTYT